MPTVTPAVIGLVVQVRVAWPLAPVQPVRLTTGPLPKAPYPSATVGAPAAKGGGVAATVATPETPTITLAASKSLPAPDSRRAIEAPSRPISPWWRCPLSARAPASMFRMCSSPVVAPRGNHLVSLQQSFGTLRETQRTHKGYSWFAREYRQHSCQKSLRERVGTTAARKRPIFGRKVDLCQRIGLSPQGEMLLAHRRTPAR